MVGSSRFIPTHTQGRLPTAPRQCFDGDVVDFGEQTVAVGRLLVVDDDPGFGELVRKIGIKCGFDVEVTNNGESFKRKYDEFDPSVTVLDVIMPDIEGIELIQWLGERGADVHVIVVTGYTDRYAVLAKKLAEARGLRSVVTLSKPVRLQELQDALNRTVEN